MSIQRHRGGRPGFLFIFETVNVIVLIGVWAPEWFGVHVPEPLFGFLGVSATLCLGSALLLERVRRKRIGGP